jgi:signal transduction histidine kinase
MMCEWDTAKFLIFSENGIPFIYYSHFTAVALFGALFLMTMLRMKPWPKAGLRTMAVAYIVWLLSDLVLWGNEQIPHVLFFWTIVNLAEPIIFAAAYTHFIAFTEKRVLTIGEKILIFLLLVPTVIMAPIGMSVVGFDYTTCDRNVVEGIAAYYNYFLEAIFIGMVLLQAVKRFFVVKADRARVYRLALSTLSLVLLMSSFLIANFLGTYLEEYNISQLGHLAVPVFAALLALITIKYETLEPRIMFIDLMSIALIVLIFSLFFITGETAQRYVILLTFILSVPLALSLVKGIRKEVRQREDLQVANSGQENLIHIMNHQIKGYLTKARNIFAELKSEPDYCAGEAAKPMLEEGFKSLTEGVDFVQQVLNASNAEKGTLTYTMKPLDFKALATEAAEKQRAVATEKNLSFTITAEEGPLSVNADELQLKEAVRNMVDNSIRYTQSGSVAINIVKKNGKALLSVKDTGVGIAPEDKPKLFQKGGRGKDSLKYNVNSTGYGLAFVKGVVEAHKGRVWAESEGPGKGSTFYMELPLA